MVEAKGDNVTKTGVRYDNDYCMVWRVENGRIKEIKEYCDSALVERVLGPFPACKAAEGGVSLEPDLHRCRKCTARSRVDVAALRGSSSSVRATTSRWQRSRALSPRARQMSERELADIGVCWSEIADEVSKPFWRE